MVNSLAGRNTGLWISQQTAVNYLLFRLYEAARQLRRALGAGIAVVIIDARAYFRFEVQLKGNEIDWSAPTFLTADDGWKRFIATQIDQYPSLPGDLGAILAEPSQIWILTQNSSFEFEWILVNER